MGPPLRTLVRNCSSAENVTSMEFILVAKVIFVGLVICLRASELIFYYMLYLAVLTQHC